MNTQKQDILNLEVKEVKEALNRISFLFANNLLHTPDWEEAVQNRRYLEQEQMDCLDRIQDEYDLNNLEDYILCQMYSYFADQGNINSVEFYCTMMDEKQIDNHQFIYFALTEDKEKLFFDFQQIFKTFKN